MPFYEYQCKHCGHQLEAMQKVNDAPLRKCPDCGKSALQRLMSAPVFRLKGGGWYETDFKSDQEGKRNLADRPEGDAGKEANKESKETAAKDATPAKDEAKSAEKPADKAAQKPPASAEKPAASTRKAGGGRAKAKAPASKSKAKKPVKRAAKR